MKPRSATAPKRGFLRAFGLLTLIAASCSVPRFEIGSGGSNPPAHCSNLIADPAETGLDCGGTCPACPVGEGCIVNGDCEGNQCNNSVCQDASCTDGTLSGAETDTDCGGGGCQPCAAGLACAVARDCVSDVCAKGTCAEASCTDTVQNGDETGTDCGGSCEPCLPGQKCKLSGDCAGVECVEGTCSLDCSAGKGNCDGMAENGCETPLTTDLEHCGACDTPCHLAHASSSCNDGVCAVTECNAPFADCDADPTNGCEVNTTSDPNNCHGCGMACPAVNGTPSCVASACQLTCQSGFSDCDADRANGCEKKTDADAQNCGACGKVCLAANGTPRCRAGVCGVSDCLPDFGDCDSDPQNGCETNLTNDPNNCKVCGSQCVAENGTPSCVDSACKIASCDASHVDCNGRFEDGCEANLASDAANCGTCNTSCSRATPFCVARVCTAHLDIAVVNATTQGVTTSHGQNLVVPHVLQTSAAANAYRLVVVGVTGFGNGAASLPSSVQYDNIAMTQAKSIAPTNQVSSAIYYMLGANLPANAGTYNVLVGSAGNDSFVLTANVVEFTNVEQASGAIDAVAGQANNSPCTVHYPSDAVNVSTVGDFIYSVAGVYGSAADKNPNFTGQTSTEQVTQGSLGTVAGYLKAPVVGPRTVTWSLASCMATAHALISIKPALTP